MKAGCVPHLATATNSKTTLKQWVLHVRSRCSNFLETSWHAAVAMLETASFDSLDRLSCRRCGAWDLTKAAYHTFACSAYADSLCNNDEPHQRLREWDVLQPYGLAHKAVHQDNRCHDQHWIHPATKSMHWKSAAHVLAVCHNLMHAKVSK
jgi:hypothetical protein